MLHKAVFANGASLAPSNFVFYITPHGSPKQNSKEKKKVIAVLLHTSTIGFKHSRKSVSYNILATSDMGYVELQRGDFCNPTPQYFLMDEDELTSKIGLDCLFHSPDNG